MLYPKVHYKFRDKKWYQKVNNVEAIDQRLAETQNTNGGILLVAFLVLSMFVGFGLGRGVKMKDRIEKGKIKHSHTVIFQDGDQKEVKVVGQNNSFVFYLTKSDKNITVSPIPQNIKAIKKISRKNDKTN